MSNFAVEMQGIVKKFPGVLANDHVDLQVKTGEIHALLGENGAGKSTLMNMLTGLYRPDEGSILVNGQPVTINSPKDARNYGIGMLHQHFMLVPTQTVAENCILGQPTPKFYLDSQRIERKISRIAERFNLDVDPRAKIWQLSVGEQQRVEILKMLYQGSKILIMDEPTAVLTPQEVDDLFITLRNMVQDGHTAIFISHKLDEVLDISDRVTILRRGRKIGTYETSSVTKTQLAESMVGREVVFRIKKEESNPGNVRLDVSNISCLNDRRLSALKSFSLQVRSGEIVGLAGVAGNGQRELAEVISGLRQSTSGQVTIDDVVVSNKPPTDAIDLKTAYIPADRTHRGSAPNLSVSDNLILKKYRTEPISRGWMMHANNATQYAELLVDQFNIKTPSVDTPSRMLSGGNLQKMILARELHESPTVILANYPTRGLDVGATEDVHSAIIGERDKGAAILLVSEDLDELLSLSDKIAVIYEGKLMGIVPSDDRLIDDIGLMMAGTKREDDAD